MKKFLRTTTGVTLMTILALGTGVGVAYAMNLTFSNGNDIQEFLGGGDLISFDNEIKLGNTDDEIRMGDGFDLIDMGAGPDWISFGGDAGAVVFEFNFSGNDDMINFTPGATTTDGLLHIRSDDIEIQANHGDVVIQLGG